VHGQSFKKGKKITILHTNDMHSAFIGMGPAADYTPFTLNDDKTRGGYARLAALLATRREARSAQGPVLTLDAGDYSMGTPFAAASRELGGELQLMGRMGYDATTVGNHDRLGTDRLLHMCEQRVRMHAALCVGRRRAHRLLEPVCARQVLAAQVLRHAYAKAARREVSMPDRESVGAFAIVPSNDLTRCLENIVLIPIYKNCKTLGKNYTGL
jgi:hypothetical protein